MQQWEVAERRYHRIKAKPDEHFVVRSDNSPLMVWLKNDVVPALPVLIAFPQFRDLATWSLRSLVRGCTSVERTAIERTESVLVRAAKATIEASEVTQVQSRLLKAHPPRAVAEPEAVVISAGGAKKVSPRKKTPPKLFDYLRAERAAVQSVAGRDWDELVVADDFFMTRQEFVDVGGGKRVQRGELINSLQPRLLPIGDLLVRSLEQRLKVRVEVVLTLQNRINQVRWKHKLCGPQLERFVAAHKDLDHELGEMDRLIFTRPDAILCDSCVVLTQVYSSFHPTPDLTWLKLPPTALQDSRGTLRGNLFRSGGGDLFDRIARALADMRKLDWQSDPTRQSLAEAIASGGLVIVGRQRKGWWEAKPLDIGSKGNWELLIALARNAKHRGPVTEGDLYSKAVAASTMPTRWNRLGVRLPATLSRRVSSGKEERSYILKLEPHQIVLFD